MQKFRVSKIKVDLIGILNSNFLMPRGIGHFIIFLTNLKKGSSNVSCVEEFYFLSSIVISIFFYQNKHAAKYKLQQ